MPSLTEHLRRSALWCEGQIVVVVDESTAADGTSWHRLPDGGLRSSDVAEATTPWIAEVSVASVSVYARPNLGEPIRRTAKQGDLLRVTGASPGIEGDTAIWWATTEGYVGLRTIREATSDWANDWALPDGSTAPGGWWGAIRSQANVRAAATTRAPVLGRLVRGDRVKVLDEVQGDAVGGNATWYHIDGGRYAGALVHSSLLHRLPDPGELLAPRHYPGYAGVDRRLCSVSVSPSKTAAGSRATSVAK